MPWDLINGVVSLGIVVVSPQGWCGDQWKDMIGAVNASMTNLSLHPVLSHVDWNRVGFMEQDVDFDTDSQDGSHPAGSKEECCSVCVANASCAAAVFDPAFRRHPASCWFKTKDQLSKKVSNPGRVACVPKTNLVLI